MLPGPFAAALAREFSNDFFTIDAKECAEFGRDRTRVYPPNPSAIAFPRSTEEVSRLLQLATAHRVPVVPSGGRTGLAGGAVAAQGEVVLSLTRMRRIDPVDELGLTVRVQAGAITEAVHQHVAALGLIWPVDFASKGSSQVGGNIATNAGGVKVIRYGLTRQWVLGLEVVLASGAVLELGGALEKNNTGLDLRQLFIGSEGTLGVITEATLKLVRLPQEGQALLFAVADLGAVLALFRAARHAGFILSAFEFFTDRCLARLLRHRPTLRIPFPKPASHYVLIEFESGQEKSLEAWFSHIDDAGLFLDAVMAQSAKQAAEFWALREGISESLSATGVPYKNDVALPLAALKPFCTELEVVFGREYPDWEICLFGHIGDGNLHVNVMKPEALDLATFFARTHAADRDLFALVRKYGGSISAEHGIGLLKKPYLGYSRSLAELEVMRAVKRALDPHWILNPGKIFD
jgi:FAD/FMN-containing dehydrogenase